MTSEVWKEVLTSDNGTKYFVSNLGRIKSVQETVLTPNIGQNGYRALSINLDGKQQRKSIHRLVAGAFLPKPKDQKFVVNHIDGNKLNNKIENLEWCSPSDNTKHSYRIGLSKSGEHHPKAKLRSEDILKIRILHSLGYSISSICSVFKASETNIRGIVNGDRRKNEKFNLEPHVVKSLGDKTLKEAISKLDENSKDIPILLNHQYNTSQDYVCLSLEDFLALVEKDKVIRKRVFKKWKHSYF